MRAAANLVAISLNILIFLILLNAIEGHDVDNKALRQRYNEIEDHSIVVEEASISTIYLAKLCSRE